MCWQWVNNIHVYTFVSVLSGIWNSDTSDDPVVEVGPFTIRNNSFHFIKSTLSDEVSVLKIDCFENSFILIILTLPNTSIYTQGKSQVCSNATLDNALN